VPIYSGASNIGSIVSCGEKKSILKPFILVKE
jgi:hypothetical protein